MDRPDLPPVSPQLLLGAVLGSLNSCVAVLDLEGRILAANPAWTGFQGDNPFVTGTGAGTSYRDLCQRLVQEGDPNLSIVALGLLSVQSGGVPQLRLDYPFGPSGETHWYGMNAVWSGQPGLGAVVHQVDITARMQTERRLRRAEGLFRITTEAAQDLISILERGGREVFHSPSYQKVLGYSPQDLAAHGFLNLVHPEDQQPFKRALELGAQAGLTQLFEFRMRTRAGGWSHLEAKAAYVENAGGGGEDTLLLISRDVTERKAVELERARMEIQLRHAQKMEAVGQLAAGIAHEINTPIQFVGDNLRFLRDSMVGLAKVVAQAESLGQAARGRPDLDREVERLQAVQDAEDIPFVLAEAPKAIQQALDGVERVATIVKAMKVFSHPGTEGAVAVDLNQAIENTLVVSRNEWKYVAEVESRFAADLPKVLCVPGEFNQVILNLVINAAHAIAEARPPGSGDKGRITVSTARDGGWAEVRVADTGTGIPESLLPQIWLPFFTTKPVGKGTGQGLSIVHSIVTRHGGTIQAESQVGQGSCFILRLPIEAPPPAG